jgi:hypothetical protein
VWDGLELLSAEQLLFNCHSLPHLAFSSCSKPLSVSAQRTLILELIVQYKCRLSVKYCIAVYSIILDLWLSKRGTRLRGCLRGMLRGKDCDKVCLPGVRYKEKHYNKYFCILHNLFVIMHKKTNFMLHRTYMFFIFS